jgi:hypothetical protein
VWWRVRSNEHSTNNRPCLNNLSSLGSCSNNPYAVESVEHLIKNDPNAGFVHKPYKTDELRDVLMRMMKREAAQL